MQPQLIPAIRPTITFNHESAPAGVIEVHNASSQLLVQRYGRAWKRYAAKLKISTGRPAATRVVLLGEQTHPDDFLVVGLASKTATDLRKVGASITRTALDAGFEHLQLEFSAELSPAQLQALIYGLYLGAYRHVRIGEVGSKSSQQNRDLHIYLAQPTDLADAEAQTLLHRSVLGAQATWQAREWAGAPSNFKNPPWLVERTQELVAALPQEVAANVSVTVLDEQALRDGGFGGILAVGAPSPTPPRLLVVKYAPNDAAPLVYVGKGITYDTGGLALKPRESMVSMKTDMSGAAIVVQAVLAAAAYGGDQPVVAVAALAENTMGAGSYRPGDVLTMVDGTTVEIGNTDAEGRLVLADAMAWASKELAPKAIIDVATLTGAITLGLGKQYSAVYTRDAALLEQLQAAASRADERIWQMPLAADYAGAMASEVADVNHIATDPHAKAGSITAALFLEQFAHNTPWVHFDIAGTGRSEGDYFDGRKGATGVIARTLAELAMGAE